MLKSDSMKDRDGTKLRLYRCRGESAKGECPAPASILGRLIEPHVVKHLTPAAGAARAEGTTIGKELKTAELECQRAQRSYDAFTASFDPTERADVERKRELKADLSRRAEELELARERAGLADLPDVEWLVDHFEAGSVAERRALIGKVFEGVVVSRAARRGQADTEQRVRLVQRGAEELPAGVERLPDGGCGSWTAGP